MAIGSVSERQEVVLAQAPILPDEFALRTLAELGSKVIEVVGFPGEMDVGCVVQHRTNQSRPRARGTSQENGAAVIIHGVPPVPRSGSRVANASRNSSLGLPVRAHETGTVGFGRCRNREERGRPGATLRSRNHPDLPIGTIDRDRGAPACHGSRDAAYGGRATRALALPMNSNGFRAGRLLRTGAARP